MIDEKNLSKLVGRLVTDLGAVANGALVLLGDKLGLYRTLAGNGRMTPAELAEKSETHERYVREWLAAQAASGFVEYHEESGQFSMTPEQVAVFADEESPVLMTGGFYSAASVFADEPKLTAAFRTGDGIPWGEHNSCLFCGTEKFFRPSYKAHLMEEWIPALDGVEMKLKRGARVADVGCGHGLSTILMAEAFPESHFTGFDFHEPSVARAREIACKSGIDNVTFDVASAKSYPGKGYELVTFFDCLHDMGDPVGAAAHVRKSLASDGTWMIVEPSAADSLSENLNPIGRVYYAFSTAVCTPSSLSQEIGAALGAQAGEARLRDVVMSGGFNHFRSAFKTPFNMVLEARP